MKEKDIRRNKYTGINIVIKDGVLLRKTSYKKGQKNGEEMRYYENGQIKVLNNYKNGELNGICIGYYEEGEVKDTVVFNCGKIVEIKNFTIEGNLRDYSNYKLNKRVYFKPDGALFEGRINLNLPKGVSVE